MKKWILLIIVMLSLSIVNANNIYKLTNKIGGNIPYDNTITFVERGIEFHVFLNGDFDFNTQFRGNNFLDYNGRRTRTTNRIRIERDRWGAVRQVGNVFINYDARGNVKRIGNVFMKYRFGKLTKIGDLRISYNRYGKPRFFGNVYRYDSLNNFSYDSYAYNNTYYYRPEFRRNYRQFREGDNFFYYRVKPNGKNGNILKRRKPNSKRSKVENNKRIEKRKSISTRNSRR